MQLWITISKPPLTLPTSAGFRSLAAIVKKDSKLAHDACQTIRKSGIGHAASKEIAMEIEEKLRRLVLFAKHRYTTQRPLAYAQATLDKLEMIEDWFRSRMDQSSSRMDQSIGMLPQQSLLMTLTVRLPSSSRLRSRASKPS